MHPKSIRRNINVPFWLWAVFVFSTLFFIALACAVHFNKTIFFDGTFIDFTRSVNSPILTSVMRIVTHLGDKVVVALVTAGIGALLYAKHRCIDLLLLVTAVTGSAGINVFLKLFFQRARPNTAFALIFEDGFSFPSGHAMASAILAVTVIIIMRNSERRTFVIVAMSTYMLLVGFSRVYLGVHYPSDVIAGFCVSIAWAVFVFIAVEHSTILDSLKSRITPRVK